MNPLTSSEIRGNWATLLLSWNTDDSLDLPRVEQTLEAILAANVDGVYAIGTAGEFHTLTEDDFDRLAAMFADRCEAANTPFQIGVSHMSAQISRERLKRCVPLKPSAFQVILPDWAPLNDVEAVRFVNDMAAIADAIGLVLYNPPHAKRVLSPAEIYRLADATSGLVGVKVADGGTEWYEAMQNNFQRLSVFIPGHHLATGFKNGAHGAYSNVACLHPGAAQQWWNRMQTDMDDALELEERLRDFFDTRIIPFISQHKYCNAACDRLLALIGGWADIGAKMRWPYESIDPAEAQRLRPVAKEQLPEFFDS